MQPGICLPQLGPTAEGAKVADVARRAEEVGYDSLWVGGRLLTPESPKDLYPVGGTEEVPYPPEFTVALDPIVTLTAAGRGRALGIAGAPEEFEESLWGMAVEAATSAGATPASCARRRG